MAIEDLDFLLPYFFCKYQGLVWNILAVNLLYEFCKKQHQKVDPAFKALAT